MNKDKITNLEMGSLIFFLIRCNYIGIVIMSVISLVRQDASISAFIGFILGFIPILIILCLMNYKPEMNIFEKIEYLFGKYFGKLINLILIIFILFYSTVTFFNLINFISSQFLYQTPIIYISAIFIIPILYAVYKGINVIARSSLLLFYISILLIILTIIGLAPKYDVTNMLPILEHGFLNSFKSSFLFIIYNTLPLLVITVIPKDKIQCNKSFNKFFILFYIIGYTVISVTLFTLLCVLGPDLSILYQYPEFHVLKEVELVGFLNRLESILSMQWGFTFFIALALNIHFIKVGVDRFIKLNNNYKLVGFISIIGLVIVSFNNSVFKNNTVANDFVLNTFPYLMGSILFGIPLLIVIMIFIRKKVKKKLY